MIFHVKIQYGVKTFLVVNSNTVLKMSRKISQNEKAKVYYDIVDRDKSIFKCNIDDCGKQLTAKNPSSLVSHIKHVHIDIYRKEINLEYLDAKTIEIKRLELIQQCAEIVTVNGRPFNYLLDSGFQNIIREKVEFLNTNNCGIAFKYPFTEIKQYIFETEVKIREQIKNEMQGQLGSIMIDIGSRNSWSILSIYIQYPIDGYIKVRNIGMIRMKERHKSEYIEELVMTQLKKFGIEKLAIFSFTTDNASNMTAAVKLFDDDIGDDAEEAEDDEDDQQRDTDSSNHSSAHQFIAHSQNVLSVDEIRNLIRLHDNTAEIDNDTDQDLACILDDGAAFRDAMNSVEMNLARTTINVNSVPCSAHTLQLAVKDALQDATEVSDIISLCRLAAKRLRRETYVYDLQAAQKFVKIVRIDCEVRWNSIYLMVRNYPVYLS